MSELYLVLRSRIPTVGDWINLGDELLRSARKRKGLSYEAMGRQLNVAAKTWERWEKAGRVPPWRLADVAEVLELEIDRPPVAARVAPLPEPDANGLTDAERLSRLEARLVKLVARLELAVGRLEQDAGQDPQPADREGPA